MSRKRVTLQQLADELGLTIQTVSKALRGLPGMSEQTRSDVMRHARERGYWTKDQKQSFRVEHITPFPMHQRRFLLVQNKWSLNFNRLLLQGLHERFMEFGHKVETLMVPDRIRVQEFREWAEERELHYADGVFIAPRMGYDEVEEELLNLPIPKILLNYPPPETRTDSVIWDVYEAMFQTVRHLLRLGHRCIMYVGDTESQRGFVLRWQAFCEAMKEAGEPVNPKEHCILRHEGSEWIKEFAVIYSTRRPTAVISGIDEEAVPVYESLRKQGISIPHQCSWAALLNEQRDDLPVCSRSLLLIKETGYRAADRMLWRIANPSMPYEHIRIRGEFHAGSTTGKPAILEV
jgi:LacI family transcriptional regulator